MNPPNPFAYIPSLYTAARDIALSVSSGSQVVALIGPYDIDELMAEVSSLMGEDVRFDQVDSSVDLVTSGKSGITCVRTLGESYAGLVGRCSSGGAHLVMLPVGLNQSELYGYGLALTSDVGSETYRSVVLDLAVGLCGGSVDCYEHVVREYVRCEGASFPDPLNLVRAYGAVRLSQVSNWRSYARDEIKAFLAFLGGLSRGEALGDAAVQATYLWAWSLGLCSRHNGTWCPSWSVVQCASESHDSELEEVADLLVHTQLRRVGIAEERAMKPIIGQYCGCAVARYLAKTGLKESEELTRASQIFDVMSFAKKHANDWGARLGDSVDMADLYGLRCSLNHLDPEEVTRDKYKNQSNRRLASFSRALSVLARLESEPYSANNRSVFL